MTGVIVKKFAFSVGNSILPICLKRYKPSKGIFILKHLIQHPDQIYSLNYRFLQANLPAKFQILPLIDFYKK